jgi:hypothetical protein
VRAKLRCLLKHTKKKGGGSTRSEGKSQKSLKRWNKEKWMTREEYEKNK